MPGLLPDVNLAGHFRYISILLQNRLWLAMWNELGITVHSFPELGLKDDDSDLVVWQKCQEKGVVLVTANRNSEGEDSLESVIRRLGMPSSLPVFTLANAERFVRDRHYAERVMSKLLESVERIDSLRGTGRVYLP